MFGDTSPRTKKVSNSALQILIATALIIFGLFGIIAQTINYKTVLAKSSSPIGTSLTFQRSDATMTIKDIYTDKNKNVLIVRIASDDLSASKLPYKGNDYDVYISSKSLKNYNKVPILFGKLSTDGDMFLVIPKPNKDVYSIFIMNKKFIAPIENSESQSSTFDAINDMENTNSSDIKNSISKSLSNYNYMENDPTSTTYDIPSDSLDYISFRLTMDPAFDNEAYKPKVLPKNLLKGNVFDFEAFFNAVFKDQVIIGLEKDYKDINKKIAQTVTAQKDLEERLIENPNDTNALAAIDEIKNSNKTLTEKQLEIANKIAEFKSISYNSDMFKDIQNTAYVVEPPK